LELLEGRAGRQIDDHRLEGAVCQLDRDAMWLSRSRHREDGDQDGRQQQHESEEAEPPVHV